jgi:hypothetical protein
MEKTNNPIVAQAGRIFGLSRKLRTEKTENPMDVADEVDRLCRGVSVRIAQRDNPPIQKIS